MLAITKFFGFINSLFIGAVNAAVGGFFKTYGEKISQNIENNLGASLMLLLTGMVGIFVVMVILMVVIFILNKTTKEKKNDKEDK